MSRLKEVWRVVSASSDITDENEMFVGMHWQSIYQTCLHWGIGGWLKYNIGKKGILRHVDLQVSIKITQSAEYTLGHDSKQSPVDVWQANECTKM